MTNTTRRGFLGWLGAVAVLRKVTVPDTTIRPTGRWTRITELSDQAYAMTPTSLPLSGPQPLDLDRIREEYRVWRRARALKELGYDA